MCESCGRGDPIRLKSAEDEVRVQASCPCPPSRLERFAEPCLLLSLAEQPAHGYQLIEKLASIGLEELAPDPTVVYRTLRRMERDGLVTSEWIPGEAGPAKRLYRLTPEGEELLHAWVLTIRKNRDILGQFLRVYAHRFSKVESRSPRAVSKPAAR